MLIISTTLGAWGQKGAQGHRKREGDVVSVAKSERGALDLRGRVEESGPSLRVLALGNQSEAVYGFQIYGRIPPDIVDPVSDPKFLGVFADPESLRDQSEAVYRIKTFGETVLALLESRFWSF
jgi:hypothetical protein